MLRRYIIIQITNKSNFFSYLFSSYLSIGNTILIKRENSLVQDAETDDNSNTKRIKPNEGEENENSPVKAEEEPKGSGDDIQNKANSRPPEPPKDYIHVRARRGQATDSHSLAERVRITSQLYTIQFYSINWSNFQISINTG